MTCWCEHCSKPFQPERPRIYCTKTCEWNEWAFANRLPNEPEEPPISLLVAHWLSIPWRPST